MNSLSHRLWIPGINLRQALPPAEAGYPFNVAGVQALTQGLTFRSAVTFLVGENGSGKSTILEALAVACGFNAEGGSVNLRFSTRTTHSALHSYLFVIRNARRPRTGFFLRAESFYNVISAIEDLDAVEAPAPPLMDGYTDQPGGTLHARSHGESFWDLLQNRFQPNGLYMLDEPESALSPHRQLAVLRRVHDLAEAGSQFFIATHSPLLLAYPHAQILLLDERGITPSTYEEVPLVRLYRAAVANPERIMRELLADDD